MSTLPTTPSSFSVEWPSQLTWEKPNPAMVAPTSPPRRACEEDDGRPSSQVRRFQTMPPTRPARTTMSRRVPCLPLSLPMNCGLGNPVFIWMPSITALVMVRATLTEINAPMRSRVAARVTAILGDSAPVAMDAAMAFPVSWKPLVKSKARAVRTTMTRMTVAVVTRPMIGGRLC